MAVTASILSHIRDHDIAILMITKSMVRTVVVSQKLNFIYKL